MSNIRFRAWHKGYEEMAVVTEIKLLGTPCAPAKIWVNYRGRVHAWYLDGGLVELMQWTGLIDKNGKDIYESDIIKLGKPHIEGDTFYVEYMKGAYLLCWKQCFKDRKDGMHLIHRDRFLGDYIPDEMEVVGNIWENPECL